MNLILLRQHCCSSVDRLGFTEGTKSKKEEVVCGSQKAVLDVEVIYSWMRMLAGGSKNACNAASNANFQERLL
jgi:hypothetical protein